MVVGIHYCLFFYHNAVLKTHTPIAIVLFLVKLQPLESGGNVRIIFPVLFCLLKCVYALLAAEKSLEGRNES